MVNEVDRKRHQLDHVSLSQKNLRHVTKMMVPCIVSFCQGLSLFQVSTSSHM